MEKAELEKLMNQPEDELLIEWFDAEMRQEVGGSIEDVAGTSEDLKKIFSKWSNKNLRQLICKEWQYCKKRKKYGKSIELISQLGDFIYLSLKFPGNIPFALSVLIVMHGFDQFCDCKEG